MITCLIHQRMVSSYLDSNRELPSWTRNHVKNCSICREFFNATMNLAQQMSIAAEKDKEPVSPFLHRKIMAGLNADEYALGYSGRARLGWALAFGAACLAAAAAVWWYQSPARDQAASKTSPAPTALTVDLPSLAQVDQWTTNLDSPLEHETQLVLSDANSALKTLARGFLPQELLHSPADNGQR